MPGTAGGFCLYRGTHRSWEILASFPKSYQVIMEYLLQRLIAPQTPKDQETGHETELSTAIVWRGRWRGWELGRNHTGVSAGLTWALGTSSRVSRMG